MIAEVFKGRFFDRYYFRLLATNGEIVAQSEAYTRKEKAMQTLRVYFPEWKVKDLTIQKEYGSSTWGR